MKENGQGPAPRGWPPGERRQEGVSEVIAGKEHIRMSYVKVYSDKGTDHPVDDFERRLELLNQRVMAIKGAFGTVMGCSTRLWRTHSTEDLLGRTPFPDDWASIAHSIYRIHNRRPDEAAPWQSATVIRMVALAYTRADVLASVNTILAPSYRNSQAVPAESRSWGR